MGKITLDEIFKSPYQKGKLSEYLLQRTLRHHNEDVVLYRNATPEEDKEKHFDKVFRNHDTDHFFSTDIKSGFQKFGKNYRDYIIAEDEAVFEKYLKKPNGKHIYKNNEKVIDPKYLNGEAEKRTGSIHGEADWLAWDMIEYFILIRRLFVEDHFDANVDRNERFLEYSFGTNPDYYINKYRGRKEKINGKDVERGDSVSVFKLKDLGEKNYVVKEVPPSKRIEWQDDYVNELINQY
tara:strand:+ start:332 stop:1042 length:711 start_codon:yes stop_codon:yes gene_type:complete